MTLIPFTPLSTIQVLPSIFSPGSGGRFLSSLISSPLPLWWIIFYGKTKADRWLYEYVRLALPRPQNPDYYSIEGAMKIGHDDVPIPEFERDPNMVFGGKRVFTEVTKDILAFADKFSKFWCGPAWRGKQKEPQDPKPNDPGEPLLALLPGPNPIQPGEYPVLATESPTVTTFEYVTPLPYDVSSPNYSNDLNHGRPLGISDPPQHSPSEPGSPISEPGYSYLTTTFSPDSRPGLEETELPPTASSTPTNTRNMEFTTPSQNQNAQKTSSSTPLFNSLSPSPLILHHSPPQVTLTTALQP